MLLTPKSFAHISFYLFVFEFEIYLLKRKFSSKNEIPIQINPLVIRHCSTLKVLTACCVLGLKWQPGEVGVSHEIQENGKEAGGQKGKRKDSARHICRDQGAVDCDFASRLCKSEMGVGCLKRPN